MRTTLSLKNDAMKELRAYAKRRCVTLGEAASELIHRGAQYQLKFRMVNGMPVFDVPGDFPVITSAKVRELLDEE